MSGNKKRSFNVELYKLLEDFTEMSSNEHDYINPHFMRALEDVLNRYSQDIPEGFDEFVMGLYEL